MSMYGASGNLAVTVCDAVAYLFARAPVHAVLSVLQAVHDWAHGKIEPSTGAVCQFPIGPEVPLALAMSATARTSGAATPPAAMFRAVQRSVPTKRAEVTPALQQGLAFVVAFNGKYVPAASVVKELNAMHERAEDEITLAKVLKGVPRNAALPLSWEHGQWVLDDSVWALTRLRAASSAAPVLTYQAICRAGLSGPRFHASAKTRFSSYPFHNTGLFMAYAQTLEDAYDSVLE